MDIDVMQRQLADLTRLVPTLVTRLDALERTIGAQQRQMSDLINLTPDKQSKSEVAAEARTEKREAAEEKREAASEARAEKK